MTEYSTRSYGAMMQDRARLDAYVEALRKSIVPGETSVIELGTGTGIVAFAAHQAGARRVVAIEPNAAIEVARQIARDNGIDAIDWIQAMSTDVDIEPADVVISDMRGITPLYQRHIPSIVDARTRLLREGGTLISRSDDLFVAPVEAPDAWEEVAGYWSQNAVGLDMSAAQRVTASAMTHHDAKPSDLLTKPHLMATLDYTTVESANVRVEAQLEVERDGIMHGISHWFDTQVDSEIKLSNAPGSPLMAYGRPFLPLVEPLTLKTGELLDLRVDAVLLRDQYHWLWAGKVVGDDTRSFEHSTLDGSDVSLKSLAGLRMDATPVLSAEGRRLVATLPLLDGSSTLEDIIERVIADTSKPRAEVVRWVSELVSSYGQRP